MKFNNTSLYLVLALTVFTGNVNAKMNTSTDLVTDKAITMALIQESLKLNSLVIDKSDFESDVKALLAQKPYQPKTRFLARNNDERITTTIASDE